MATLEDIPAGNAGLAVKLQRLRGLVDRARADPAVRERALRIVAGIPERDYGAEIAAVSRYVRQMRYTRDPVGVELFTDPRRLVAQIDAGDLAAGDCDDAAGLGAALFESIGHRTRFRVGGHRNGMARDPAWAHIWTEVLDPSNGRWTAVDDTAKMQPAGWDPSARFDAHVTEDETMRGYPQRQQFGGTVHVLELPEELGGLKKSFRKIRKAVVPKVVQKAVAPLKKAVKPIARKVEKTVKKGLPVLALAANIIPGVGQAASLALSAAAVAVKQQQKKKAKAAAAAAQVAAVQEQARYDAEMRAAQQWNDEQARLQAQYDAEAAAAAAPVAVDPWQPAPVEVWSPPAMDTAPQWSPVLYDDGGTWEYDGPRSIDGLAFDWGGLLQQVVAAAPQVIQTAQSGAFGSRVAAAAGRVAPAVQRVTAAATPIIRQQQQQQQQQQQRTAARPPSSPSSLLLLAVGAGLLLLGRRR